MPLKNKLISTIRSNLPRLKSRYGLRKIGVFGSYASGKQNKFSDVDLIVEFDKPLGLKFIEFGREMEHILKKKTDILTTAGIESIRNRKIASKIKKTVIYV